MMRIFGIVAEYNPFHNGHLYQINEIKHRLGADAIIAVMSGDFVQRGEPALLDKYARGRMAVENGVDLVLQLPVAASTASAELFARSGMALLLSTGEVTDIAFGCEGDARDIFAPAARILNEEPPLFQQTLREGLREGLPFSKARALALCRAWDTASAMSPEEAAISPSARMEAISLPNNILGIEYTRALLRQGADIPIHPIPRVGVSHDAPTASDRWASATLLRQRLESTIEIIKRTRTYPAYNMADFTSLQSFVPENVFSILCDSAREGLLVFPNDISPLLHHSLLSLDAQEVLDCPNELFHRIQNLRDDYVDFLQFADLLHTKNMELSRIRRVLLHIMLRLSPDSATALKTCGYAPYLHILGFSPTGAALLKDIKTHLRSAKAEGTPPTPLLFSSINEVRQLLDAPAHDSSSLTTAQASLLRHDVYAADLYRILQTEKSRRPLPTEFTRKFI